MKSACTRCGDFISTDGADTPLCGPCKAGASAHRIRRLTLPGLPSTLDEIQRKADAHFQCYRWRDTVEVRATWGTVTVFRDGSMETADSFPAGIAT